MALFRNFLNTQRWMNPRLIPKAPGFKFRARLKDGRSVNCETWRKEFAIAISVRSDEVPGLKFEDIDSWVGF